MEAPDLMAIAILQAAVVAGLLLLDTMNATFKHWVRELERMEPSIEYIPEREMADNEGSFREVHCQRRKI